MAFSSQGFVQGGDMQLAYLPRLSELQGGFVVGFPMCMTTQMHAALKNGQEVSVIIAVLDDVGVAPAEAEPTTLHKSEERITKKLNKKGAPRAMTIQERKWVPRGPESIVHPVDARSLCTEEGSRVACRVMAANEHLAAEYAYFIKGRLGMLMQNHFGSRVLCAMIERLPYGRRASSESEATRIVAEVIEALPRAAMQATGKNVYISLLAKARQEGALPSKTTRTLAERLSRDICPMVHCSQASQVLQGAFQVDYLRKSLELAVVEKVGDICTTPQGCRFLAYLLEHRQSEEVAMAILESRECFQSLSWDTAWSRILVQAGEFSPLHRSQLADMVRHASLDECQRCTHKVKLAALWR